MRASPCQTQAGYPAQQRKYQTLNQELRYQPPPRSADGETDTDLSVSRRRPRQQQIADVCAGNQQHQSRDRQKNQELLLQLIAPSKSARAGSVQDQPLIERLFA